MKKLTALMLALVMMFSLLAGCSKDEETTTAAPTTAASGETTTAGGEVESNEPYGVFHNYLISDVDTINPHIYTMSDSGTIFGLVSMGLYRYVPNETGDGFIFTTDLAESDPQQMDDEGKVWQIKILENAKWENGDAITIDDVIYSWQMCLDPILVNSRASQMASDYITIVNAKEYSLQGTENTVEWEDVGIKKVDDYTVELTVTDPVTALDVKSHLNYTWNRLVHKDTYEAYMNEDRSATTFGSTGDKFMSCGPFLLKEWIQGSQFTLVHNPDYVHADEYSLAGYEYRIVGDSNTALELFLKGELDVVNVNADSIEQYIDDPRLQQSPASSITSICVNMGNTENNGILGNVDFRKALYYAIDREAIAKMTNGIAANWTVPTKCIADLETGVTFRNMDESNAYIPANLGYDKALAKELYDKALAEVGLSELKLTLLYNEASANYKKIVEYLDKQLPEVFGDSFDLELMAATSNVCTEYRQGWRADKKGDPNSFELTFTGWNTSTTAPWNGLKVYSGTYTNKNEPYFNDEYDAIWQEANLGLEAKLDNAYRLELTRQMEKITIDEAVTIPMYEAPGNYLIADRIVLPSNGYIPGYGFGYALSSIVE